MTDRRSAAVVAALLAFGVALRIALQLPLHRWANEGDCVTIGFGAWEILAGDPRIFVSTGVRQGALSCYLAAAAALFVGAGRAALALEVCFVGIAQIFVWWLALLELTGWKARSAGSARLLAFIVLPSSAVLYWGIYWPNGYPEIFLSAIVVLWTGARCWRRGGGGNRFAFAVASGFAFWMSMLTLAVTIPVCLWLVWQRGRELLPLRRLLPLIAGGLLGALPWLLFNLRYDWVSLSSNWAVRPASGAGVALENAGRYFGKVLPGLFAAMEQAGYAQLAVGVHRLLELCAVALFAVSLALLARAAFRARRADATDRAPGELPGKVDGFLPQFVLAAGIVGTSAALFALSAAGSMTGNVVRYSLPVFLVWPLVVALAWEVSGRALRTGLAVLALVVLSGYAWEVPWPWTAERRDLQSALAVERSMIARLEERGVEAIFGSFWEVYPLIFESGGRFTGSTLEEGFDFHRLEDKLPQGACRWALLGRDRGQKQRAVAIGADGRQEAFPGRRWMFISKAHSLPSPADPPCREILARLRERSRS